MLDTVVRFLSNFASSIGDQGKPSAGTSFDHAQTAKLKLTDTRLLQSCGQTCHQHVRAARGHRRVHLSDQRTKHESFVTMMLLRGLHWVKERGASQQSVSPATTAVDEEPLGQSLTTDQLVYRYCRQNASAHVLDLH